MIKKIILTLILCFLIVSCGKKGDPEYKEQSREWYDKHRADWASRYSEFGASEVIPQSVWDSLFDYIIVDYMTPREFLDEISSSMR